MNSRKSKIIAGCVYKHPNIDVSGFNKKYLKTLLDKFLKETSKFFFLVTLILTYSIAMIINLHMNFSFLVSLVSTTITIHSKVLIDNIFSNVVSYEVISGNITATISDHLPQFLFAPNVLSSRLST